MAKRHCHWLQDQMDLSYLNGPDINALAIEADWKDIDTVMICWAVLRPPVECIELLFPRLHGHSILSIIETLTEVGTQDWHAGFQ